MDAVIALDEQQRIVLYNRAAERIFGWPAAEVLGAPSGLLLPERYRAAHAEHLQRFGATGTSSRRMSGSSVVYGLRRGGEEFPVDASISRLDTPEGRLYTVVLRDVSERVRAQEELVAFAAESAGAREQEKARIARELHDELAQSLTVLSMDTAWLRANLGQADAALARLARMQEVLEESVAAIRRIAADLRPPVLDDLGLVAAVEWLAASFSERNGIRCELDVDPALDIREPQATALFRILQESLVNVAKHARAASVEVRLARTARELVLSIQDDGVGFRAGDPRKPQSLGLVGLRERARLLRGTLALASAPGKGTRIEVRVPLDPGR